MNRIGQAIIWGLGCGAILAIVATIVFPPGKVHHIYLPAIIQDDPFADEIKLLRDANENDIVVIHLAGYGGSVLTGTKLVNAIKSSPAHVHMSVDAPVYSMHALLACAGDTVYIQNRTFLMFHTYQTRGFLTPEQAETYDAHAYQIMGMCYDKNILTFNEIVSMIKDKQEVYLLSQEANRRLTEDSTGD